MSGPRIALAAGLALIVIALGVVMSRSPITVAGTNSVPAEKAVAYTHTSETGCQKGGTLPRGTSAIRVSMLASIGPRVSLTVLAGSRVLTRGEHPSGWGEDETVTVPVRPISHAVRDVVICTTVGPAIEYLQLNGTQATSSSHEDRGLAGVRLRMEYLRPRKRSWLSIAPSISRLLGLGHAATGTWIVFLVLTLVIAVAVLASRSTFRELR